MKLSFLDFGRVAKDKINSHKVIENLFSMSSTLDTLGCHRFWLGEHYGVENTVSWYSPRILLPLLLANTAKMKIGTGGELLKYHSPLLMTHDYILLSALFGGRVDLGIAKGGNLPQNIKKELYQEDTSISVFIEKIQKTALFLSEDKENDIQMPLVGTAKPDLWFLGAARNSFESIAEIKGNLSMSLFHKPDLFSDKNIARDYKNIFHDLNGYSPEVSMSVLCYCTNDLREKDLIIKKLCKSYTAEVMKKGVIVDTAENVFECLQEVKEYFDIDEILVHNDSDSIEEKNKILQLFKYAHQQKVGENILKAPLALSA